MPKFVLLWTDVVLWLLLLALVGYVWRVRAQRRTCAPTGDKVFARPAGAGVGDRAGAVPACVTLLDSVHFRRALPPRRARAAARRRPTTPRTESLLDAVLARLIAIARDRPTRGRSPTRGFTKESVRARRRRPCASFRGCSSAART